MNSLMKTGLNQERKINYNIQPLPFYKTFYCNITLLLIKVTLGLLVQKPRLYLNADSFLSNITLRNGN